MEETHLEALSDDCVVLRVRRSSEARRELENHFRERRQEACELLLVLCGVVSEVAHDSKAKALEKSYKIFYKFIILVKDSVIQ